MIQWLELPFLVEDFSAGFVWCSKSQNFIWLQRTTVFKSVKYRPDEHGDFLVEVGEGAYQHIYLLLSLIPASKSYWSASQSPLMHLAQNTLFLRNL